LELSQSSNTSFGDLKTMAGELSQHMHIVLERLDSINDNTQAYSEEATSTQNTHSEVLVDIKNTLTRLEQRAVDFQSLQTSTSAEAQD
jgi:uncharacterized coiled-coil DUF342 family protein